VCGPEAAHGRRWDSCPDRTRVQTRVWLEVEDEPDRRALPIGEREGEERGGIGWAGGGGEVGWASWAAQGGRRKNKGCWALRVEGERGEKERESGPGPKRKRGRKRNAFECF
jgi:hypothetical protein